MMFDEQPDGDPHGECAHEIAQLQQHRDELVYAVHSLLQVIAGIHHDDAEALMQARAAVRKAAA